MHMRVYKKTGVFLFLIIFHDYIVIVLHLDDHDLSNDKQEREKKIQKHCIKNSFFCLLYQQMA